MHASVMILQYLTQTGYGEKGFQSDLSEFVQGVRLQRFQWVDS